MKKISVFAVGAACLALITACGGGGDSALSPPPSGGGPSGPSGPTTIEGVATPSSVSVVTATNAN